MNGQGPNNGDGALRSESGFDARQALSALMDGDADDGTVARACAAWRSHAHSRADWHAYHVIGDVLRTADQGPSSLGDAAFVEALRRRLEGEPIVLAPESVAAPAAADVRAAAAVAAGRRGGWRVPIAAAAGVAAVASVVFLMRPASLDAQAPLVATSPAVVAPAVAPAVATAAPVQAPAPVRVGTRDTAPRESAPFVVVRDPRMLRDERLDRYLDAHRQFAEGALSVTPAGTVRGVSTVAPER